MRCRSLAFLAVLLMVPIAALAQTNPFDGLNTGGRAYLDPSVYAQQKAQWLARVDAMPETDLPAMAFDTGDMTKARSYAEQLLTEVGSDRSQWNYGDAVHKGNLILGRIAVREGRLAEAVTFLRASGDTPGSGVLNSFGPNMSRRRTCWNAVRWKRCSTTSSRAGYSGRWVEPVSMPGARTFKPATFQISARTFGTDRHHFKTPRRSSSRTARALSP